jgi:hypothetical protein
LETVSTWISPAPREVPLRHQKQNHCDWTYDIEILIVFLQHFKNRTDDFNFKMTHLLISTTEGNIKIKLRFEMKEKWRKWNHHRISVLFQTVPMLHRRLVRSSQSWFRRVITMDVVSIVQSRTLSFK